MSPISDTVAAVLLAALAIAVTAAGVQTVRLAGAKQALAENVSVHASERAESERIARETAAENQIGRASCRERV